MLSNAFLFRVDPFQKGIGIPENEPEVTKFISLVKNGFNLQSVSIYLTL